MKPGLTLRRDARAPPFLVNPWIGLLGIAIVSMLSDEYRRCFMAAKPNGFLTWNIAEIAKALKIGEADVCEYFTDGRRVSFLLERRLAYEVMKGTLAPSEGAGYDLLDSQGLKWEVRSITKGGIYFCPSYMVGSGRSFNESGFLVKLQEVAGYIISDVESFPDVPFWILPKSTVEEWWKERKLGSSTKITRNVALRMLESS